MFIPHFFKPKPSFNPHASWVGGLDVGACQYPVNVGKKSIHLYEGHYQPSRNPLVFRCFFYVFRQDPKIYPSCFSQVVYELIIHPLLHCYTTIVLTSQCYLVTKRLCLSFFAFTCSFSKCLSHHCYRGFSYINRILKGPGW